MSKSSTGSAFVVQMRGQQNVVMCQERREEFQCLKSMSGCYEALGAALVLRQHALESCAAGLSWCFSFPPWGTDSNTTKTCLQPTSGKGCVVQPLLLRSGLHIPLQTARGYRQERLGRGWIWSLSWSGSFTWGRARGSVKDIKVKTPPPGRISGVHPNVHCSTTYNSQDMEAPWVSNRWMDKDAVSMHNEYYSARTKREIGPCAATWMVLEIIILSEISQKEKDKYHMISLCGILKNDKNKLICKIGTDTQT